MKKVVIGLLAERFDEDYQNTVWTGASAEAARLGASMVFFSGRRLGSPVGHEALDNVAFELAERSGLGGLIVMANVIGTFVTAEEEAAFIARFRDVPVVTVGLSFPGVACVAVDASGGMRSIAEHLVREHARRRFLFLAGPPGHTEAEARCLEFEGALREIAPDAEFSVLQGDFTEERAAASVASFLDSPGGPGSFDAVVAANDLMALGAMRALAARGVDVPRAVSVTGFDDTGHSRLSVPPLTTVRQPIAELGFLAVRRVASSLGLEPGEEGGEAGSEPPRVAFVCRQSCGCAFGAADERQRWGTGGEGGGEGLAGGEGASGRGVAVPASAEGIFELVNLEVRAGRSPSGLRSLPFAAELRGVAFLAIAEGEARFLSSRRIEAERRGEVLSEILSSLVSSFGLEEVLAETARAAREFGISACWLSLFEGEGRARGWSRLLLAMDPRGTRILAPQGLRFRTAELVPGGLPEEWSSYVCEPLCFGEDRLGYLVCTEDAGDRRMYEALRDQVSAAIKGALLMAAERDRERDLESKVRARMLELSAANERLVEEMSRRKALERELLGISNRIMGDIGRDIHDNLCQDIAGLGIMAAVLEGRLRRGGDGEGADAAATLARIAGETAAKAKGMARGLYPAELEAKGGLPRAVDRLVEAAAAGLRGKGPVLRLEKTRGFAVRDPEKALHLFRIVQEALGNALRHARATEIKVGLYMDRETVMVEVADDGVGLPYDLHDDAGMGLRILKYRASVIGGELRMRSLDRGTVVSCRTPR